MPTAPFDERRPHVDIEAPEGERLAAHVVRSADNSGGADFVVDGELEVEAVTYADQRELGMTWSPLGMRRVPSKLIVRARLMREERAGR